MGVPLRHVDVSLCQQLAHPIKFHALFHQVSGKIMPQIVVTEFEAQLVPRPDEAKVQAGIFFSLIFFYFVKFSIKTSCS